MVSTKSIGFTRFYRTPPHTSRCFPITLLTMCGQPLLALSFFLSYSLHSGRSALHWACSVNHLPLTRTLVRYGAAVDLQDHKVHNRHSLVYSYIPDLKLRNDHHPTCYFLIGRNSFVSFGPPRLLRYGTIPSPQWGQSGAVGLQRAASAGCGS